MVELIKSATFEQWLTGLRDVNAVARIQARDIRQAKRVAGEWRD